MRPIMSRAPEVRPQLSNADVDQAVRVLADCAPHSETLHVAIRASLNDMRRRLAAHEGAETANAIMTRLFASVSSARTYATADTIPVPSREWPPVPTMPAPSGIGEFRPTPLPPSDQAPISEEMFRAATAPQPVPEFASEGMWFGPPPGCENDPLAAHLLQTGGGG